jgi:hypothetical protein
MLIRCYGVQALAVAREHSAELQLQGDTADLAAWRQVEAAISDFRTSQRKIDQHPNAAS